MATKKDETKEAEKDTSTATEEPEVKRIDETVPGGRYEVDGKMVDSSGKPVK